MLYLAQQSSFPTTSFANSFSFDANLVLPSSDPERVRPSCLEEGRFNIAGELAGIVLRVCGLDIGGGRMGGLVEVLMEGGAGGGGAPMLFSIVLAGFKKYEGERFGAPLGSIS
jgi:hypothetical protein